jgi:hypothetical protein
MRRRLLLGAAGAAFLGFPFAATATTARHRRRGAWIEAQKAMENAGFSNLQGLNMDGNTWRATGDKDGKRWAVAYSHEAGVTAKPVE